MLSSSENALKPACQQDLEYILRVTASVKEKQKLNNKSKP